MRLSTLLPLVLGLTACGGPAPSSRTLERDLRAEEALADFDQLVGQFRAYYGPLEFKTDRFAFDFDARVATLRERVAASTSDVDTYAAMAELAYGMRDGHVSFNLDPEDDLAFAYSVPLFAYPVEDTVLLGSVDPSLADLPLRVGDEVVAVDGKAPLAYLPLITRYAAFANELSDRHLVYRVFRREAWMKELIPTKDTVDIDLRRPNGETYTVSLAWRQVGGQTRAPRADGLAGLDAGFVVAGAADYNAAAQGSLQEMGTLRPFFATPQVGAAFDLVEVQPNATYLAKYGLTPATAKPIYAALYQHAGKTLLLVRQPTYSVPDGDAYVATYKAILDQYDGLVSALVIDQTHNPGGSSDYAEGFVRLFVSGKARGMVQRHNADRKWIQTYQAVAKAVDPTLQNELARLFLQRGRLVEKAYDAGDTLTEPMPVFGLAYLEPHADYTWTKPVLLLANELAGSCGDIVPMLMQRNALAKVFGARTMGLGGNVEEVPLLTNSRILMKMTRGMFTTYEPSGTYRSVDFVENNGIEPDLPFSPTVADARAGFVAYFKAFSDAAAAL